MSENLEFSKELRVTETNIPGLLVVDIPVHGDNRGWFKENWQREKMIKAGLPDFKPVQNNISFNHEKGVTRGLHAEPWDKYVSVATGRIHGAWVDLREGPTFGQMFETDVTPDRAIFVPRGVANGYQALEDNTAYTYLVTDHWSEAAVSQYTFVNLGDETAGVHWPIPLDLAELSDKDKAHPALSDVVPMKPKKTLITGANGQLGRALQALYPDAECIDRDTFDITNPAEYETKRWQDYELILNAAAYTAVDQAETPEGREAAWAVNAKAVQLLAQVAMKHDITLVHISSDYVFDGTKEVHTEDENFAPLGVYAQTKAAGDIAAGLVPKHYIARTSWVIGDGKNFIEIMRGLAEKDVSPSVVNDQIGRLTFTQDLAAGIKHLVDSSAAYGTYNLTNDGDSVSWADVAKWAYEACGKDPEMVTGVTTDEYYKDKGGIAARPLQSTLSLEKLKASGFTPRDLSEAFAEYMSSTKENS